MPTAGARSGTLERAGAGDVRSHRRVYDRMNSVMTAGLHQRWRERAVDLAPRRPATARSTSRRAPGDLALALARRIGRTGAVSARTSRTACSSSPAARRPARVGARVLRVGRRPRAARIATARSPRRPSASAPATSRTSTAGSRRWRGWCARAAASSCSRSPRRASRPCRRSSVVVRSGRAAARPLAGDPDAYTYLPSSSSAFPGPEGLAARMAAGVWTDVAQDPH
jgi:demethylmenaquinone methyltransferase/2-methoxy-6-polyprenyl-1,4-benzoquinol methylase